MDKQEPVAWDIEGYGDPSSMPDAIHTVPLYPEPVSKPWVSLTDEQIRNFYWPYKPTVNEYVRFIESKIKELNHGN